MAAANELQMLGRLRAVGDNLPELAEDLTMLGQLTGQLPMRQYNDYLLLMEKGQLSPAQVISSLATRMPGIDTRLMTLMNQPATIQALDEVLVQGASTSDVMSRLTEIAAAQGITVDTLSPVLSHLVPFVSRIVAEQLGVPPAVISEAARGFSMLDSSLHLTRSYIRPAVNTILTSLLQATQLAAANPLATVAIVGGLAVGYQMLFSQSKEAERLERMGQRKITDEERAAFNMTENLRKIILSAEKKDKDMHMAVALAESLKGDMHPKRRHILRKEFEENILSILSRELQPLLTKPIQLSEFSSVSAKRRALRKLENGRAEKVRQGYPSNPIGIDRINFTRQ